LVLNLCDVATETIVPASFGVGTQTNVKALADKEIQVEPEVLLVSGVPSEICKIGLISRYLEKFGSLTNVTVSSN
jgi:hypothetical protein